MAYKNNIGPQVRRRRYNLGLSQAALAAKLQLAGYDISRSGVSKIEARLRRFEDEDFMGVKYPFFTFLAFPPLYR
jgi:transcriptional regulator with XRE-family HTH domain